MSSGGIYPVSSSSQSRAGQMLAGKNVNKAAKLSQQDWARLWVKEGGDPGKADLASAIVMAESGGDTDVYNGICCHGGYQFNTNTLSVKCAKNPTCATRAAIRITGNGKNWDKWETYTKGEHKQYLGKSGTSGPGLLGNVGGAVGDAASAVTSPFSSVANAIGTIAKFIARLFQPSFWQRVGTGLLGFLLLAFALVALLKSMIAPDIRATPIGAAKDALNPTT